MFTFCKTQPGSDKQMDSFWHKIILHKILKLSIEGGMCSYKQLMLCFPSHQNYFQTWSRIMIFCPRLTINKNQLLSNATPLRLNIIKKKYLDKVWTNQTNMQTGNAVWNALPAMYLDPESSLTSEFNQAKSSIISLQPLQLIKPT